jgi:hypothetical protein
MESKYLEIELYKEGVQYCAYISENGSSGYAIKGKSIKHCAERVKEYIIDSFYRLEEEED